MAWIILKSTQHKYIISIILKIIVFQTHKIKLIKQSNYSDSIKVKDLPLKYKKNDLKTKKFKIKNVKKPDIWIR